MTEVARDIDEMKRRAGNLKPAWNGVEDILRKDMREQLEGSHGPDGKSYTPLKGSTLKRPRRSSRPYDTMERNTWDAYAKKGGGRITRDKDKLSISIDTEGAAPAAAKGRVVGISDHAADEIIDYLADYIVEGVT